MSSAVDADLLVYAHNASVSQHAGARAFVETTMLGDGDEEFVMVHQTLFELYSALSSALILPKPLTGLEAWGVCRIYLEHPRLQTVAYAPPVIEIIEALLKQHPHRGKRFFDLVLAATLKYHGITKIYTHNTKHFRGYEFLKVENPLLEPRFF